MIPPHGTSADLPRTFASRPERGQPLRATPCDERDDAGCEKVESYNLATASERCRSASASEWHVVTAACDALHHLGAIEDHPHRSRQTSANPLLRRARVS